MASRHEIVEQAIRFARPARVPIVYWNRDQCDGDVLLYHLSLGTAADGSSTSNLWDWSTSEWGYSLDSLGDGTIGHPTQPYYAELPAPGHVSAPPLKEAERMAGVPDYVRTCEDRYRLASLDLSGFTVYTLLRGFENAMEDFLLRESRFASLMDTILQFECDLMAMTARHGFHGIHFADDWGTQSGLMVSPALWRRLFKPRYRRQFELAHRLGLDVWYHCCGDFGSIAADFHEIGVDVLNISQPNVVNLEAVGLQLRGRQCFLMPLSYQTTSIGGTPCEIVDEAERMYRLLGTAAGGFIGYVEEYGCMGMSAANYRACGEAFQRLRPELL